MIEILLSILMIVSWAVLGFFIYKSYRMFCRQVMNCRKELVEILGLEEKILAQTEKILKGDMK